MAPVPKKLTVIKAKPAVVKPTVNDLLSIPGPNLNVSPTLAEDHDKNSITQTDVFPPDPVELFTPEELDSDDPTAAYWALSDMASTRFPMLRLRLGQKDAPHQSSTMAFIDESYGCTNPPIGGIAPPTWMDPEIFVRMAMKDEEVVRLSKIAVARNSYRNMPELDKAVQRVFEEQYLPYMLDQFDKVKRLLSCWFVARTLWTDPKQTDYRPGPEKSKKKLAS